MGCTSSNNKNMTKNCESKNDILTEEFKQDLEEQINQFLIHKKPICIGFIIEDKNKHTLKEKFLAICRHIICAISILNLSIVPCSKKWLKSQTNIQKDLKDNINLYLTIKLPEPFETNQEYSLSSGISNSSRLDTSSSCRSHLIIPPAPSLQTSYDESETCQKELTKTDASNEVLLKLKDNIKMLRKENNKEALNKLEILTKEDTNSKVKRWLLDSHSLYTSHICKDTIYQKPYFEPNETMSCNDCCSHSANLTSSDICKRRLNNFLSPSNPLSNKILRSLPLEFSTRKYSPSMTNSLVSLKKFCETNQEIYVDSNYVIHQHFHEHHHYFHYD